MRSFFFDRKVRPTEEKRSAKDCTAAVYLIVRKNKNGENKRWEMQKQIQMLKNG